MVRYWLAFVALTLGALLTGCGARGISHGMAQPTLPITGSSRIVMSSVSCPSATACMAVGVHITPHATTPVAEQWDGTRWSYWHLPGGAGANASSFGVASVSCADAGDCMAVGQTGLVSAGAWRWDGLGWSQVRTGTAESLLAVSCPSADACIAIGNSGYDNTDPGNWFAQWWNGTSWSLLEQSPQSAQSSLSALSCVSTDDCMAVGQQGNGDQRPLAEVWNGYSWTALHPPLPHGFGSGALSAVSCTSVAACVAVGTAMGEPNVRNYAVAWNGASWSLLPSMPGQGTDLNQLSCVLGQCVVVGHDPAAPKALPLSWNGTRWAVEPMPDPSRSADVELDGVSCVSAAFCEAVGFYQYAGNPNLDAPLAERRLVQPCRLGTCAAWTTHRGLGGPAFF